MVLFSVGYILHGIFVSALSGTYSAMMYDSIKSKKPDVKKKLFTILQGRLQFAYLGGVTVGNIAGSLLAREYSLNLLFFISIAPAILNIFLLLGLKEPSRPKQAQAASLRKTLRLPRQSLAWLGLFLIFAVLTQFRNDYFQLFVASNGSAEAFDVGAVWTLMIMMVALGGLYAHKFMGRLRVRSLLVAVPTLYIASIVGGWLGIFSLSIAGGLTGVVAVLINERLNSTFPSNRRSILLSTVSSIKSVIAIISTIVIGLASEAYGLNNVAGYTGVLALVGLAAFYIVQRSKAAPDN